MRRYDKNLKKIKFKYDLMLRELYNENKEEIDCFVLYKKLNRVNIDAKRHNEIILEIKKYFNKEDYTDAEIIEFLLQGMKRVEEIVGAYKKEAKQYLIDNNIKLNYVSSTRLNQTNQVIVPTKKITRYFEHAGKFVTACAEEKSIYLTAGQLGDLGMIKIHENIFVFPTNETVSVRDGHIFLNEPVYLYQFDANEFEPVVSVIKTNSVPRILYDDEWISASSQPVTSCKVITDLTSLIDSHGFFMFNNCNVAKNRMLIIAASDGNKRLVRKFLKDMLFADKITFLNQEAKKQQEITK